MEKDKSKNQIAKADLIVIKVGDRSFRFEKRRIVLGSVVSADVRVVGEGIAPIHAVLERDPETSELTLYDIASDTGVFVNGKRTITSSIKPGDSIALGSTQLSIGFEKEKQGAIPEKIWKSGGENLYGDPQEDLAPLVLESMREVNEIFDYRPSAKRAVEVVMSWHGSILDIEHFVDRSSVTIGPQRSCDFGIPPVLGPRAERLIEFTQGRFVLHHHAKMTGVVQSKGQLRKLQDLSSTVEFGVDDFAKVSVGEVDFYLSFTAAPPRLKRRRVVEKDPAFRRTLGASLLFMALLLWALIRMEGSQMVEMEELPERIATILYQPEKFTSMVKPEPKPLEKVEKKEKPQPKKEPVPPKPKKITLDIKPSEKPPLKEIPKELTLEPEKKAPSVPKVAQKRPGPATPSKPKSQPLPKQNQGNEGAGERAKGTEGKRGAPHAPKSDTPQNKATRPGPSAQSGGVGSVKSQVQGAGNIGMLEGVGSQIQNLLGGASAGLSKGGEKVRGFGVFNTEGNQGLALSGKGSGGGGSAEDLAGLSNHGKGGGRVGTGLGAAGKGGSIIGGKGRVVINTGGGDETVMLGAIDKSAVEAALLAHRDEFRLCYEREINAETPDLSGRVSTTFVIGSSGRVTQAGILSSSLGNANAEGCILDVIRRIAFPVPRGGGVVQVNYPFKFRSVRN